MGLLRLVFAGLWCAVVAPCFAARAGDGGLCKAAVAAVERGAFVPDRLMQAISIVESGRRDGAGGVAAWPWTINVEGVGEVFDTKQQAIAAVTAHRARGARSIDVGCMQVNLLHHGDAFASLEEAFDPAANARYAARFLLRLLDQTGSWPRAVAGYHSLTPEIGDGYAKKVMAVWARPEPGREGAARAAVMAAGAASPGVAGGASPGAFPGGAAGGAPGAPPASLPGGTGGRMLLQAGGGAAGATGRGLEAYRAMPTRLVTAALARR